MFLVMLATSKEEVGKRKLLKKLQSKLPPLTGRLPEKR